MAYIPESAAWRGTRNEQQALDAALALAKGDYQRAVLTGGEALSGSTLRGKAKKYSARYAESRAALLARIRAAGIDCEEIRVGPRGKRVLCWGRVARGARAAAVVEEFLRTPQEVAERALRVLGGMQHYTDDEIGARNLLAQYRSKVAA